MVALILHLLCSRLAGLTGRLTAPSPLETVTSPFSPVYPSLEGNP
jgi:hypothetical protein